jgi:hypothetical protein
LPCRWKGVTELMPEATAIGGPAVIQSLQFLMESDGRPFTVRPGAVRLEPGSIWTGDAIILSATPGSVHYARGDSLFREETHTFVADVYSHDAKRPVWMNLLFRDYRGFALRMAPAFSFFWGPRGSVCAWLSRYSAFYASNRGDLELAARYSEQLLEALLSLSTRWNSLFRELIGSLGEFAPEVLARWVGSTDYASLLAVLLGAQGQNEIKLEDLSSKFAELRESPTSEFEACLSEPIYARMVQRAEDAASELAPLVSRLRTQL